MTLKPLVALLFMLPLIVGHEAVGTKIKKPQKIAVYPKQCHHGLTYGPGKKFAVYVFCDDAVGTTIGIINTKPGVCADVVGPTLEQEQVWRLEKRFWQEECWCRDVEFIEWSTDGLKLTVFTGYIYGTNKKYVLDLLHRKIESETDSPAFGWFHSFSEWLLLNAKTQIGQTIHYNPAYKPIAYPNGDVPLKEGVCTDVIIRSLRVLGIDLQARIHQDMQKNWARYPKKWGLKKPDPNIDHRRVPNISCYFHACGLESTDKKYLPGDIVVWDLGGGIQHIGFVSDQKAPGKNHLLVVHNIGKGVQEEDILYRFKIIDHFRIHKKF